MRFLILLLCTILVGCNNQPSSPQTVKGPSKEYEIILVDGCQYIEVYHPGNYCYSLTHKGDCLNRIHPEHERK